MDEYMRRRAETRATRETETVRPPNRNVAPESGPVKSPNKIISLLKELRTDTTMLVKQEMALAKTEMSEKVNKFSRNGIYIGAGGAIALMGVLFLLIALTMGLFVGFLGAGMSPEVSLWLAPLIVGLVVAIIGGVMMTKGTTAIKEEPFKPERTVNTLKEDLEWAQKKIS